MTFFENNNSLKGDIIMHMADALISPAVGVSMWGVTLATASYSIKRVQDEIDENKIPLMGVMGAFVFASQMINFTIPATGSSGHIGGGMLLAILLGPYAGFDYGIYIDNTSFIFRRWGIASLRMQYI